MSDNHVFHCWLHETQSGAKIGIDILFDGTPQNARDILAAYLADGYSVNAPGLEGATDEPNQVIVTVMRRAKPADDTPIIDFYPEWGNPSTSGKAQFGTYKSLHAYLNDDAAIEMFLKAAGFESLNAIPLYESQGALTRTPNKRHAKETSVPTPFKVFWTVGKPKKNEATGEMYEPKYLTRYEALTGAEQSSTEPNPPANATSTPPDAKSGQSSGAPGWWHVVLGEKQLRVLFNNVGEHFANKVKKMLREGLLTDEMDARKVIETIKETVAFDNLQPPERRDIPF